MASTLFKKVDYNADRLIDEIRTGEIGLPDIQRPFVWKPIKVRDLFDSMYQGFPVGYLLFWANGGLDGTRQIGTGSQQSAPRLLIVDGQQRLTSLYSVITGTPVLNDDFREKTMRIAFRPRDGRFAVTDAAIEKDPEFIPDITAIWQTSGRRRFMREFFERLATGGDVSDEDEEKLHDAVDRLYDLQKYPFTALELSKEVNEEQVAEVFVRVNSAGVQLNQDDFILTLMSVFWEDGRKALEQFTRDARTPTVGTPSPFNHFIEPKPGQMLRVAVAVGIERGALRNVYALLRGRDVTSGQFDPATREAQFARLSAGQQHALDLTNWHEFLKVLIRAGFRGGKMITSETAVLYAYAFFLLGRHKHGVDAHRLRGVISRWYFMTALTGRYTSGGESRVEQDLALLPRTQDADGFVQALDAVIDQTLTPDFWTITLPGRLATSSARSPELFAYYSALILLDARVLFSSMRITELFDPALNARRSALERHHLFPKAHLARNEITSTRDTNQIANYALLEWPDNAAISDKAPADYFPGLLARLNDEIETARTHHALPAGWEGMEYGPFLEARRRLMADVIHQGFRRLSDVQEEQVVDLPALVAEGESQTLEFKSTMRHNLHTGQRDPDLEHVIIKTVAGFANASGGTLLIGVGDNGQPLGLDHDLSSVKGRDLDGFELALRDLFERSLGRVTASAIQVTFPDLAGVTVCRVGVPSAGRPVYANRPKGDRTDDFFLRTGNSTRKLTPQEVVDFLQQRLVAAAV